MKFLAILALSCCAALAQPFPGTPVIGAGKPLQAGLIAYWDLHEGSGQIIHNRMADYPGNNLLVGTERHYSASHIWGHSAQITVTDGNAVDPNGTTNAAHVVSSAGGNYNIIQAGLTVTGGVSYTVSGYATTTNASPQTFRFIASDTVSHFSPTLTATNGWQRFVYTYTANASSSANFGIQTDSSLNGFDIHIWGLQWEQSASATPYVPASWHGCLGNTLGIEANTDPTWTATNTLTFTTGSGARSAFLYGPLIRFTNITIYGLTRWTGAPVFSGYGPVISTADSAIQMTGNCVSTTQNYPQFTFGTKVTSSVFSEISLNTWRVVVGVCEGGICRTYVDDCLVATNTSASATIEADFLIGNVNWVAYMPGQFAAGMIYNRAHSNREITQTVNYLRALAWSKSIAFSPLSLFPLFEGDSITQGSLAASAMYPLKTLAHLSPRGNGYNNAVASSTVIDLTNRASLVDTRLTNRGRKNNVLVLLPPCGEITSMGATNWVAWVKGYCLSRKQAGWKILLCTILPRNDASFNTQRNLANPLLIADTSFRDALADIGNDATIGPDAAASNLTYYSDGTHPTAAAHDIIYPYIVTALNSL